MAADFSVGLVQMRSSTDPWENLLKVNAFVEEARESGAQLVCFPENVFYRGPKKNNENSREETYLSLDDRNRLREISDFSAELGVFLRNWQTWVSLGSVFECEPGNDRPFNSHWVISPEGEVFPYRKIHLFDFNAPGGVAYRESEECRPGEELRTVDVHGFRLGLSICFDLRFAELYRDLVLKERAEVLLVPAAFTRSTGLAHWHALLRARAIENQCFVVASGQSGIHFNATGQELACFGNSVAYGPWGDQLACLPDDGEGLTVIKLRKSEIADVRARLPAIENARYFRNRQ